MKTLLKTAVLLILLIGIRDNNLAQNAKQVVIEIPKTSLVAIAPSGDNSITIYPKIENNQAIITSSNYWINYSSIKGSNTNPFQRITAAISHGSLPEGHQLIIEAGQDAGKGGGIVGIPIGRQNVTSEFQTLITAIGSSYTGNSINQGHQLSIEIVKDLSIDDSPVNPEDLEPITIEFRIL